MADDLMQQMKNFAHPEKADREEQQNIAKAMNESGLQDVEGSKLSSFYSSAKESAANVLGSQLDFGDTVGNYLHQNYGTDTENLMGAEKTKQKLNDIINENSPIAPQKDYSLLDRIPFASDYYTNPQGFSRESGNLAGSAAALGAEAAALNYVAGGVAPLIGVGSLGAKLAGLGAKATQKGIPFAEKILTKAAPLASYEAAKTLPEVASEAGNTIQTVREQGGDVNEQMKAGMKNAAVQVPLLTLSNILEGANIAGAIGGYGGKSALGKVGHRALGTIGTGAQQAGEEIMQQGADEYGRGKQTLSGIFLNPSDEALQQGKQALAPSMALGLIGGAGGKAAKEAGYNPNLENQNIRERLDKIIAESGNNGDSLNSAFENNNTTQGAIESYLRGKGLTVEDTAAIMGNLKHEGGFDNTGKEEDNGGGFGLAQWTGERRDKLNAYAAERGTDPSDLNTQLNFMWNELNSSHKGALESLVKADGIDAKTKAFMDNYEAPNTDPNINHIDRRQQSARAFLSGEDTTTETNGSSFVDNMRSLEGRITHYAEDGTNCMRTIGLALAGTPFAGQINVDQAVATGEEMNLLRDSANYTPKAGDIAIVNGGNHAVMVTENGGTIQNGASHNGVYEDSQSPEQMFGKVKYYIATSELNGNSSDKVNYTDGEIDKINKEMEEQQSEIDKTYAKQQAESDKQKAELANQKPKTERQLALEAKAYLDDAALEVKSVDEITQISRAKQQGNQAIIQEAEKRGWQNPNNSKNAQNSTDNITKPAITNTIARIAVLPSTATPNIQEEKNTLKTKPSERNFESSKKKTPTLNIATQEDNFNGKSVNEQEDVGEKTFSGMPTRVIIGGQVFEVKDKQASNIITNYNRRVKGIDKMKTPTLTEWANQEVNAITSGVKNNNAQSVVAANHTLNTINQELTKRGEVPILYKSEAAKKEEKVPSKKTAKEVTLKKNNSESLEKRKAKNENSIKTTEDMLAKSQDEKAKAQWQKNADALKEENNTIDKILEQRKEGKQNGSKSKNKKIVQSTKEDNNENSKPEQVEKVSNNQDNEKRDKEVKEETISNDTDYKGFLNGKTKEEAGNIKSELETKKKAFGKTYTDKQSIENKLLRSASESRGQIYVLAQDKDGRYYIGSKKDRTQPYGESNVKRQYLTKNQAAYAKYLRDNYLTPAQKLEPPRAKTGKATKEQAPTVMEETQAPQAKEKPVNPMNIRTEKAFNELGYKDKGGNKLTIKNLLSLYYAPNRIVLSLGGYDKIISFDPSTNMVWTQAVVFKDGKWVNDPRYKEPRHYQVNKTNFPAFVGFLEHEGYDSSSSGEATKKSKKIDINIVANDKNNKQYQIAFHGSPYDFKNFDLGSIGTGEGNQAHGWGLYFAQKEKTSRGYAKKGSMGEITYNGADLEHSTGNAKIILEHLGNVQLMDMISEGESKEAVDYAKHLLKQRIRENKEVLEQLNKTLSLMEGEASLDDIAEELGREGYVFNLLRQAVKEFSNPPHIDAGNGTKYLKGAKTIYGYISKRERVTANFIDKLTKEEKALESADYSLLKVNSGNMYKVDIPESDVLLDEQKIFNNQLPKVQEGIINSIADMLAQTRGLQFKEVNGKWQTLNRQGDKVLGTDEVGSKAEAVNLFAPSTKNWTDMDGYDLYNKLSDYLDSEKDASLLLNKNGIKGITYNGRQDGHCFVVFDNNAISIIDKYNQLARQQEAVNARTVDEVKQELNSINGITAETINDRQTRITFGNGKSLILDIKDNILISPQEEAKARKEHGMDNAEPITVEGFYENAKTLDANALIEVALNSNKGTVQHEMFHALWDLCLTDKEKQAMLKHYTPIAENKGQSVYEVMADASIDWGKSKGGMFGKLYKKIKDIASKLYTAITGKESSRNVMNKVVSGEIASRKGVQDIHTGDTAQRMYSLTSNLKSNFKQIFSGKGTKFTRRNIKKSLEDLTGYNIRGGYKGGDSALIKAERMIRTKNSYDWQNTMPRVGQLLAEKWDLKGMHNEISAWLQDPVSLENINKSAYDKIVNRVSKDMDEFARATLVQDNFRTWASMSEQAKLASMIDMQEEGKESRLSAFKRKYFSRQAIFDITEPITKAERAYEKTYGADALNEDVRPSANVQRWRGRSAIADALVRGNKETMAKLQELFPNVNLTNVRSLVDCYEGTHILDGIENAREFEAYEMALRNLEARSKNEGLADRRDKLQGEIDEVDYKIKKAGDAQYREFLRDKKEKLNKKLEKAQGYHLDESIDWDKVEEEIKNVPKEYVVAHARLQKLHRALTDILVDSGMISVEAYENTMTAWKDYVPLFRVAENEEFSGYGDSEKAFNNSQLQTIDPIESTIRSIHRVIDKAETNKVKAVISQFCSVCDKENFIPFSKSEKANDKTIAVKVDGKNVYFETTPEIKQAVDSLRPPQLNSFLKLMAAMTSIMKALITSLNPRFGMSNALRDPQDAIFFARGINMGRWVKNWVKMFTGGFDWNDPLFREFALYGGSQSGFIGASRSFSNSIKNDIIKWNTDEHTTLENASHAFDEIVDKVGYLGEQSEYVTRIATYEYARDAAYKDNLKKGYSKKDAYRLACKEGARVSRDTMDFQRMGSFGKGWNTYSIFSNAALQGLDNTYRKSGMQNMYDGFKSRDKALFYKGTKQMGVYLFKLGVFMAVKYALTMWNNSDDDKKKRYAAIPQYEKDNNWIFLTKDGALKLPKPQEYFSYTLTGLEDRYLSYMLGQKSAKNNLSTIIINQLPSVAPSLAMPFIEYMANYDFFRERNIVPRSQEKLPNYMQYSDTTSAFAKFLGQKLNLSPRKIDHLVYGYGGTNAKNISNIDKIGKEGILPKNASEIPLVGRFFVNPHGGSQYVTDWYNIKAEQTALYNEYLITKKKPEDFDPATMAKIKNTSNVMTQIQKNITAARNNTSLTTEERDKRVEYWTKKQEEIAKKVVDSAK